MRIAYCGYDFFYPCLEELVRNGHTLVELFTWPTDNRYDFNDYVLRLAKQSRARITLSAIKQADLERLSSLGVDAIVSAAYPYKIPRWQGHVKYGLNVHPSPLPEGRGPWPLPWLILKQFDEGAVSIHELSESWDSGDLIAKATFPLSDRETLESLSLRCQLLAKSLVRDTIANIDVLWSTKQPQEKGSYWPMPVDSDRTIDWRMGVHEIERIVRAFSKFESFVVLDGRRYYVRRADVWEADHGFDPGTLVLKSNKEAVYAASDGLVCLSQYVKAEENED